MTGPDERKELIASKLREIHTALHDLQKGIASGSTDRSIKEKLDEVISDFEVNELNQLEEKLKDFIF